MSLRRLLAREDGISLIEMLVALGIFTVAVLGLLGGLITSAHALVDQAARADGVRVATEQLEQFKTLSWSDPVLVAGTTTSSVTRNNRTYDVTTTISEQSADPSGALIAAPVKMVTVTAGWTVRGQARSVTVDTALLPDASTSVPVTAQYIGEITMTPAVVKVDDTGSNVEPVDVTIPLVNFPISTPVTLTWSDFGGSKNSTVLFDAGVGKHRATLDPGDLLVDPSAGPTWDITFTATAGTQTKAYTLQLQRPPDTPLTIDTVTITPLPLPVAAMHNGKCNGNNRCTNTQDVIFTADVTGFDATQDVDKVQVQFTLQEPAGETKVVDLVRTTPTLPSGGSGWSLTLPANTVLFDGPTSGTAPREFTFIAVRASDGARTEFTVSHNVTRVP